MPRQFRSAWWKTLGQLALIHHALRLLGVAAADCLLVEGPPEGEALLGAVTPQLEPDANAGLAERLVQSYLAFAVANGLDPTDAATNFPLFLASDKGKALVGEAAGYIDTSSLQKQLEGVLADYMRDVMTAYMGTDHG